MTRTFDIVIVGTGAGGGTVAERLSRLLPGASIALLEAGPNYPPSHFTQREAEMMGLFWHGGGWPTKDGAITLAAGKAVGGSTLVYTGVTFRLPDEVLGEWDVPGLTPEDLAPRFDRLEAEISVITPGPEMVNDNNRLFKEACDSLGWPVETLRLNLRNCEQMGFCNLGCACGAKQGTAQVQIPAALGRGVTLVPNCRVDRVSDGRVSAYVSPAPADTLPGPWESGEVNIEARAVVLCAGTPGTPAIMQRSGLGERLPVLGRYLTMHPAITLYGIQPAPIKNYQGFPKTYYTGKFSHSHGFYMETAFYYPFITTKHLGLWGRDLKFAMSRYRNFQTVIILNHDPALPENRVSLDKSGDPVLDYTIHPSTISSLCHSQRSATRLFLESGCTHAIMPCAEKPLFTAREGKNANLNEFISEARFILNKMPISSAHPQGGCRMGNGPADSVTDGFGRVHGVKNLWVADASLFPKSSHVNPYLTIMALADRVAENVAESVR